MHIASLFLLAGMASSVWAQSYTVSTFAGGKLPPLPAAGTSISIGFQTGIGVDSAGNVYIPDEVTSLVYKLAEGSLSVVAGQGGCGGTATGGSAVMTDLCFPLALTADAAGDFYVAQDQTVFKITASGIITAFAGNGSYGYSGDGGAATSAELSYISGLWVDAGGNVYLADQGNSVIRKVATSGIITTVAGNGTPGYAGDGGPATEAQLSNPGSMAVDSGGNIYIADTYNQRIRKVSASGVINTIAGDGFCGFSGDGGPAVAAELCYPQGVAVDSSGNVYIADSNNERVRQITTGGVINTVVGDGNYGFTGDGGPATSLHLSTRRESLWIPTVICLLSTGVTFESGR